jgi:hypothetical protein
MTMIIKWVAQLDFIAITQFIEIKKNFISYIVDIYYISIKI